MMDILNTIQADTVILKIDVEGYECKVSTLIQYYYVIKGKKLGVDTTTHHQSSTGGYGKKDGRKGLIFWGSGGEEGGLRNKNLVNVK